jgi:hypothetical protein
VTQEDEKPGADGDSKKEGEDAPDAQSEEENGKAENADSKDEKMETNEVTEKPAEEPTKEQDVPNNATPSDNIDNLKKDAVQHDGMNNGESVAPATAAVAV